MSEIKLSEYLTAWRADRPDEWTMDNFIVQAKQLEKEISELKEELNNETNGNRRHRATKG